MAPLQLLRMAAMAKCCAYEDAAASDIVLHQ
jgi:hypothetical protein